MTEAADPITFSVPRAVLSDISTLFGELLEHMHELLEKKAEGKLGATQAAELRTLVQIAEFSQIVTMALQSSGK